MSDTRLKTACLGLDEQGQGLLKAARESELFDIIAVGGEETELAETIAAACQCPAFDDYRQLIIQNQLDVLIVAAPIYLCDEHIRAAMKKKINVLKVPPAGLDFEQTAEMVRLANKEGVRFAVADTSRFRPGFSALREYMLSADPSQFRVISALSNRPVEPSELHDRWLSDPQLAGGGVLLHDCYEMIDQIVLNFGIPEQVYSLNSNHAPDKQQRLSITEDTVVMTMRFSDTLMGNLIASRMFGPAEKLLKIHGNDECLVVTDDSFTVLDNQGNTKSKSRSKIKKGQDQAKMLEAFASSILSPEESGPLAGSNIDLKNMAVIEAGYLSARTGMPEGPSRILDMVKT